MIRIERKAILECEARVDRIEQAQTLLQTVAQGVQQKAHASIAGVVTRCLEAIFEDPYTFQIVFDRKRGKTEARLVFVREGEEVDPLEESGGGVVDVAAFALKLACLLLSRPPARRMVVMDEPFKFVDEDNLPRVRELLEQLAVELDVQFILTTHLRPLYEGAEMVVRLEKQRPGRNKVAPPVRRRGRSSVRKSAAV